MAAVSADQLIQFRAAQNAVEETVAIGTGQTVYVGTLVNYSTTGRVVSAAAALSRRFAGAVTDIINDSGAILSAATGNTAGTVKCRIQHNIEMLLNIKTQTRTFTQLGKTVNVLDNVTVGGTAVGTALLRVACGQLVAFEATNKTTGWVALRVVGDTVAI